MTTTQSATAESNTYSISQLQERVESLLKLITQLQKAMEDMKNDSYHEEDDTDDPLTCFQFSSPLARGSSDATSGGEVSKLQRFLAQNSSWYPEGEVSGFYGELTERAVQRFQHAHKIVSSGNAYTTGYGTFGAQTRTVVSQLCNDDEDDEDRIVRTIDVIDSITVTEEGSKRASVEVALDGETDIDFDITLGSKSAMVTVIARALERSFNFDFDEFRTTRVRDAALYDLIDWEQENEDLSYEIDDVKSVRSTYVDPIKNAADDEYTLYDIVLKDGEKIEVKGCGFCTREMFEKAFTDTGYEGDVDDLLDMVEDIEEDNETYTLEDVKSVTSKAVDPIQNAIDDEYTLYVVTLDSGTKHEVKQCGFCPQSSRDKAFTDTGYEGDVDDLRDMATPATSSNDYSLGDVKKVTKEVIDPEPKIMSNGSVMETSDDESTVYVITLKSGATHTVTLSGYMTFSSVEKLFKATGYTGKVRSLMDMATDITTEAPSCSISASKTAIPASGASVTFTWTAKHNTAASLWGAGSSANPFKSGNGSYTFFVKPKTQVLQVWGPGGSADCKVVLTQENN